MNITVLKDGKEVFAAQDGRLGVHDSARLDFLGFASGIIGASYTILEDASLRLGSMGYVVEMDEPAQRVILITDLQAFIVGGAVRDMLLGLEPKDIDYVVVGSSIEQMEALGFKQVGADFPVFLHEQTGEEYALARSEKKVAAGYHGFKVEFSPLVTLEEDLIRRDLTINAMAMREGVVVDPYGGQEDLANKVLRHTSLAFQEDPVRVLRLARFAARYTDFTIHPDTMALMKSMVENGELDALTPERVFAEFVKGLMEKKPSKMFDVLFEIGATKIFWEFLNHHPDRLTALDFAASVNAKLEERFAIIAAGFKSTADFKKWTINSDCEEVAALVNNNLSCIMHYESLSAEERVQLFNRCDMRRRPDRFAKVLKSVMYILDYSSSKPSFVYPVTIEIDMGAVCRVDGGKIAELITDKTKIKDAIFKAQCEAINETARLLGNADKQNGNAGCS